MNRAPRVLGIRVAGAALVASAAWYVPWLLRSADWATAWLSAPFVLANLWIITSTVVTLINNWQRSVPRSHLLPGGCEPLVAVIIPTCGEPAWMVRRTLQSVLNQDWPHDRLLVVVSDDAHCERMAHMAQVLAARHPLVRIIYHEPPAREDPRRQGAAKAGNLNSALELVRRTYPTVDVIETRDADDEVGDKQFLREAVGQLSHDSRVAFVQTVKEARVGGGDPFGNNDPLFYRGAMYARNAANAVFPCGSGLVWRITALEHIGGFPTWNLVEDLQSGVEALRHGWRGLYLPIVGAVGQTAPEDIPNVYKQRGTWALDTMRLLLFGRLRGLSLRQKLHFAELGLFYGLSLAALVLLICPVIALAFGRYPLVTTHGSYVAHFWPFALSVEAFLAALATGHRYETLWRARQMWVGMAPVYAKACVLALRYGPRRKPTYRVTRKNTEAAWYWRETLPQSVLLAALLCAVGYGAATSSIIERLDIGSVYWAAFSSIFLAGFIRKSWYGVSRRPRRTATSPSGAPSMHDRVIDLRDPAVPAPAVISRDRPSDTQPLRIRQPS